MHDAMMSWAISVLNEKPRLVAEVKFIGSVPIVRCSLRFDFHVCRVCYHIVKSLSLHHIERIFWDVALRSLVDTE
jgi:hypothetical protein